MGQGFDLFGSFARILPERRPPSIPGAGLDRFLIIKLSSIGDVVHALPVASALKARYPASRITWAIDDWTAPLVRGHAAIDRTVIFPTLAKGRRNTRRWMTEFQRAVRDLRSEPYDVALDLQGLARSALLAWLSRSPLRIARAGQREGAHLIWYGVPLPSGKAHAVDEYLSVAKFLGAEAPVTFGLVVSQDAATSVSSLLSGNGIGGDVRLIVINPSASKRWKGWPTDRWTAVVDALSDQGATVLVGSANQRDQHAEIAARAGRRPVDLTGKTTLSEVVALLARCALHIAPDTGTAHIAAALGRPVVGLYGPTKPWRLAPYGQAHRVVYHGDQCGRWCPAYCLRNRRCLAAATPQEIVERASQVLRDITAFDPAPNST